MPATNINGALDAAFQDSHPVPIRQLSSFPSQEVASTCAPYFTSRLASDETEYRYIYLRWTMAQLEQPESLPSPISDSQRWTRA
jgi:hypothetical protein